MTTGKGLNLEEKRRFWSEHIQRMEESELSQVEYCRLNNLNKRRVWYWKRKFLKQTRSVVLVEVRANSMKSSYDTLNHGTPIRMTVAGRFSFEIEKGFDPITLRQTLQVLESL